MAICDGGGVKGRIQENVTEKQQWRLTGERSRKTTMAICDGGGVEGRKQENVAEK
ncbi:hypothetical protein DPMN_161386 [Dreissena polymorpha]|uniref:Uncharacterized protein n=1 Tax=Dreissena polymorpha TaxID=45954 RepID=A0A9D4EQB9_DREPO|nr:hypothetical protein DPMN_161386 [Dreissena polymorpha]